MRIPDSVLQQVREGTDIVETARSMTRLTRCGHLWKGCCPIPGHRDRTASFVVYPSGGGGEVPHAHCYGCGWHGDVIALAMVRDSMGFREEVKHLADRCGVALPEDGRDGKTTAGREGLLRLLEAAAEAFRGSLARSPAALSYLERREITPETAARFRLGAAGVSSISCLLPGGGHAGFTEAACRAAGLLAAGPGGSKRDFFTNRLMFPLIDERGRVAGFAGRTYLDGDTRPDRYRNSPGSPAWRKREFLYGLFQARQAIARSKRVILVEGFFDVLRLAQEGFEEAVSPCGTAFSDRQLEKVLATGADAYICTDGDEAGRKAAGRMARMFIAKIADGRRVFVVRIPDGEDPDSLVRKRGAAAFEKLLEEAQPLSEYFLQEARAFRGTMEDRARAIREAAGVIRSIGAAAVLRQQMAEELLRIGGERVAMLVYGIGPASQQPPVPEQPPARAGGPGQPPEPAGQEQERMEEARRMALICCRAMKEYGDGRVTGTSPAGDLDSRA